MDKVNGMSMDIEQNERDKLQVLFPQCFKEGKLDIDMLLNLCGEYIDEDFEKYKFEWKGKAECFRIAGKRSTGTLRPAPDESVDFDTTKNLYIEGDNLEVLKLLQTAYFRKVKMIYIDPPYNTGNDFVYNDDFSDPIAHYKEITSQATKSNPESMGRFHTAWLNMMYPRLRLAANLLRDDGVIFISIDDTEFENLKKLCNEIFGEENHLGTFIWKRRQMVDSRSKTGVSSDHEYVVCYSKYDGRIRGKSTDMSKYGNPDNDPKGDWMSADMTGLATASQRPNLHYDLTNPATGITYPCPPTGWRYEKSRMDNLIADGEVIFPKDPKGRPRRKKYVKDLSGEFAGFSTVLDTVYNTQATRELRTIFDDKEYFDFPKPVDLIKMLVQQGSVAADEDDSAIILDFFSGSATTAHAVMQLNTEDGGNRRFILVQLPEVNAEKSDAHKDGYSSIAEIGKERIRRAGLKIQSEHEANNTQLSVDGNEQAPIDVGFRVFKLDTSNLHAWDGTPINDGNTQTLWERFDAREKTIKRDRSDLDMVFEVMLKMGIHLDYVVSEITVGNRKCYSIGERPFESSQDCMILVCLDFGITPEDITAFCDLAPAKIIAAEEAFEDSTAMSNAHYILRDRDIEMKLL
ncbi:MAG: site-specific DNA-methyltransferase [Oscillospiraceae bacterium]|nr:site-specific DNA-methyltransferase [Oscillospiraceae bacterium]